MSIIRSSAAACVVALAALAAASPARAAGTAAPHDFYTLRKDTLYESGCFAPCMCPVLIRGPVQGKMRLVFEGADGSFRVYRVDDLRWIVHEPSQDLVVTGSGTYRVGGAFAPQQQMSLDLQVGSDPVQRFDSGLVPAPVPFPHIDVRISINGEYCHDTVFDLRARRARGLGLDPVAISWELEPPASAHDIVTGSLQALRQSGGDFASAVLGCAASGVAGESIPAGADPPPGEGFWFLLRDVESGIAGSYDSGEAAQSGWADAGIAGSPLACP